MDIRFWYVRPDEEGCKNCLFDPFFILFRNGHYNDICVQHPRSHLCNLIPTCTLASNNLSCCKIKKQCNNLTYTETGFQGFITQRTFDLLSKRTCNHLFSPTTLSLAHNRRNPLGFLNLLLLPLLPSHTPPLQLIPQLILNLLSQLLPG